MTPYPNTANRHDHWPSPAAGSSGVPGPAGPDPARGEGPNGFTSRLATPGDASRLRLVMDAAIRELQRGFLTPEQIQSSRAIMGIDNQLIADKTYYVIEHDGVIVGCGGWSRRATLYGTDSSPGRDSQLLDPSIHAARVRAMYTQPSFARQGVGRMILKLCERAAAAEGFQSLELMGTLSGRQLYSAYGFVPVEHTEDASGGVGVPLVKMEKSIHPAPADGHQHTHDRP